MPGKLPAVPVIIGSGTKQSCNKDKSGTQIELIWVPSNRAANANRKSSLSTPAGAQEQQEEIDEIQVEGKCTQDDQPAHTLATFQLLGHFFETLGVPDCESSEDQDTGEVIGLVQPLREGEKPQEEAGENPSHENHQQEQTQTAQVALDHQADDAGQEEHAGCNPEGMGNDALGVENKNAGNGETSQGRIEKEQQEGDTRRHTHHGSAKGGDNDDLDYE